MKNWKRILAALLVLTMLFSMAALSEEQIIPEAAGEQVQVEEQSEDELIEEETEEAAQEAPAGEEAAGEAAEEEPAVEEPVIEEPVIEEPVVEEPVIEEPEEESQKAEEMPDAEESEAQEAAPEIEREIQLPDNLPEDFDVNALLRMVRASSYCAHEKLSLELIIENWKFKGVNNSKHRYTYHLTGYKLSCRSCGETVLTIPTDRKITILTNGHDWVHENRNKQNNKFKCSVCGKKWTAKYPCKHKKLVLGESRGVATCPICGAAVSFCKHEHYTLIPDGSTETFYRQVNGSQHLVESYKIRYFGVAEGWLPGTEYANCEDCGILLGISNGEIVSVDESSPGFAKDLQPTRFESHVFKDGVCTKCGEKRGIESITLSASSVILGVGEKQTLKASYSPSDVKNTIRYTSSNPKIVAVDSKTGRITAKKVGSATITAMADNSTSKTCNVIVKEAPKSLSLNAESWTLTQSEQKELIATLPEGTASKLTAKSSNSKIASVKEVGSGRFLVTAESEGNAKITVSTANKKTKSITIKVVDPYKPTGVKLDRTGTVELDMRNTLTLRATLQPSTARSDLNWKSSNVKIATVQNGVVKPLKEGKVKITVTTVKKNAKGKKMSASVTIKIVNANRPTGIALENQTNITISEGESKQLIPTLNPSTAVTGLTWKTSNKKYVTVDQQGKIKGIKKGKATISVTTYNGKTAKCTVTVEESSGPAHSPEVDPYAP